MIGNHQWWLPIIDGYQSIPSMIRINDPHRQILMIGNHWFTTSHILVHWWSLQDRPYIIVHLSEAFRNILRFFDFWFIVDQLKSDHNIVNTLSEYLQAWKISRRFRSQYACFSQEFVRMSKCGRRRGRRNSYLVLDIINMRRAKRYSLQWLTLANNWLI